MYFISAALLHAARYAGTFGTLHASHLTRTAKVVPADMHAGDAPHKQSIPIAASWSEPCAMFGMQSVSQTFTCKEVCHVPDEGKSEAMHSKRCFNEGQAPCAQRNTN